MKKLLWIPLLLLLTFVGDRIGGWVLKQVVEKSQFRYTRLYKGQAEAEVLLVGNSRGLIFYQPHIEAITEKNTFNICYNGMPIDVARRLIEDYFEHYTAPQQLLLDVTMCDRSNNPLMAGFNMYTPYSQNLEELILDSIPKSGYAGKLSHLYRYNSEVFQRTLAYMNKSDESWTNERVMNDFLVEEAKNLKPYHISYDTVYSGELRAIAQLCQAKGTQLHFLVNPYYPPFAQSINNLDSIKQVILAETQIPVKDYSTLLKDHQYFSDYQHTNTEGSKKYLDQLKLDGILD